MTKSKSSASVAQEQEIEEIFVPVIGFENRYRISNLGRLISFNRGNNSGGFIANEHEMTPSICSQGEQTEAK